MVTMGDVLVERDPFLAPLLEWVPERGHPPTGGSSCSAARPASARPPSSGCWPAGSAPDVTVRRGFCDNVATPAPLGPVIDALPGARRPHRGDDRFHPAAAVPRDPGAVGRAPHRAAARGRALGRRGDAGAGPVPRPPTGRDAAARRRDVPRRRGRAGRPAHGAARRPRHRAGASTGCTCRRSAPTRSRPSWRTPGSGLDADALLPPDRRQPVLRDRGAGRRCRGRAVDGARRRAGPLRRPLAGRTRRAGGGRGPRPRRLARGLLAEVAAQPAEAVDECVDHGMLVADQGGTGFAFRHEIARETVEASLSAGARTRLHPPRWPRSSGWAASTTTGWPTMRPAAARQEDAVRYSVAAAARSARLGAHREAAREYRLALRFPEVLDREPTADLYDRLSYECYLTNEPEARPRRAPRGARAPRAGRTRRPRRSARPSAGCRGCPGSSAAARTPTATPTSPSPPSNRSAPATSWRWR